MSVIEDDIHQITSSIWELMLELPVSRCADGVLAGKKEGFIIGCAQIAGYVQIHGAWEVTVLLECSQVLAHRITTTLFDMASHDITPDDLQDAVGELTNMISGSFKSLLPGSCTLSIPAVSEDFDYDALTERTVASRVAFVCEGEPFLVTLLIPDDLQPDALQLARGYG